MQDKPDLSAQILATSGPIDAVLDIVGNTTLVVSLAMIRNDGRLCLVGFLGGGDPVQDFNPLMHMPSGVQFSFFGSAFVFGTKAFPLDIIPFQSFIDAVQQGKFDAEPSQVFALPDMAKAHALIESSGAGGKLVITI